MPAARVAGSGPAGARGVSGMGRGGVDVRAQEAGFRLRFPATSLWFNVDGPTWEGVASALRAHGAETAHGGLEGEVICAVDGLVVSYRPADTRLQAELGPEGGMAAAMCLSALLERLADPAATASPVWLWAPEPFRVGSQVAAPAVRFVRAARWLLDRGRAADALAAAAHAVEALGAEVQLTCQVEARVDLEVRTPLAAEDRESVRRRSHAFATLLRRLGEPVRVDFATFAVG